MGARGLRGFGRESMREADGVRLVDPRLARAVP